MAGQFKERFDVRTFFTSLALVIVGLISIYSATYDAGLSDIAFKQMIWAGGGLVIMLIIAYSPFRLIQFLAYPSYFATILLLISVLLLGRTVSGSQSWFSLGALRLQPSEFAKLTTALALATYLSRSDVSLQQLKHLLVASGIVLLPVVLILLQPDAGTAIIYLAMFLPVLYWGGASHFVIVAAIAPPAVGLAALFGTTPFLIAVLVFGVLLYLTKQNRVLAAMVFSATVLVGVSSQFIYDGLKPYQQKRIQTFLDPSSADPRGAGYNVLQSKVAIGSGGVLGKGYLQGTQTQLNFIPEQWTDFIFCVPGEEFGFFGACAVLFLFTALLVRGVHVAAIVKNKFASFLAIAVVGVFAPHIFINVGMALGLLPVIGVPLPFLSYGGSALLANVMMVGLLMNLYANRKEY